MKLLLAYDGLENSREALEKAAELAGEGGTVTVLTVARPDKRRASDSRNATLAYAEGFLRLRGVAAATKIARGDTAEAILDEAGAGGYDTIVLGTRELSPLGRVIRRSVTRDVVKHSPCKVVVAGALSGSREFEPVG